MTDLNGLMNKRLEVMDIIKVTGPLDTIKVTGPLDTKVDPLEVTLSTGVVGAGNCILFFTSS